MSLQRGSESQNAGLVLGSQQNAEDFAGTDRFLVQRRVGAGAFGVVYEAYDRQEHGLVALKVLRFAEADALYRFKKGFRSLADIRHPNLVSFYELTADEGLWFFSMELVPGVDFVEALTGRAAPGRTFEQADSLESTTVGPATAGSGAAPGDTESPPDFDRVRHITRQLARGLHTVHRHGKVHRDIKPPNVLVTAEDRAVLLDFGLVTELQQIGMPEAEPQTVGTPAYMSPEQALALPGSPASDWYSVGVMLYQALAGELPFTGTAIEIMAGKQTGAPPPLGDVPADLEELCAGLLDPDPETRLGGEEVLRRLETPGWVSRAPRRAPPEPEAPFIGREQLMAELEDAFAASHRRAVTVYLRGASGMGKTALLERFIARLDEGELPAVVLAGRCYLQESVPYKALDMVIDALSRYLTSLPEPEIRALLPAEVGPLTRLFPVLLRVGPMASVERPVLEPSPDPHALRRRAFAGLRELFCRLTARRRLVIVIDDLQWGDLDSFQLLDEILQPPEPPPLLLIGACRSEDEGASPFLRALAEHEAPGWHATDTRRLDVGRLSPGEARELIGELSQQGVEGASSRAEGILREADGNPLFLSELARFSDRRAAPSSAEVGLGEVIRTRVEALPAAARRLLETVAVAGKPLDLDVARQAADLGSGGPAALAQLRTQKLIRELGGEERDEIEAYHDRIRETVAEGLKAPALRRIHHALAVALESSGRADPETLAVHFQATEEVVRARDYARTAAARATDALAFERAVRLYRLALDLTADSGHERYALEVALGEALANAGRSREAAETFLTAVGHSGPIDPGEAQRHAAEKLLISGHIDRGMAILRHVLRTLDMRLPQRSWKSLLDLWWHRLRLRLTGLRFEEKAAGDCDPQQLRRIDVYWSVEIGLCLVDVLRASEFHARHLLAALAAGEPERVARGLAMEVFFGAMDGAGGDQVLQQARGLAGRVRGRYAACLTEMAAGMSACSRGSWGPAHHSLVRAEDQLRESRAGVAWELDTVRHFRVLALLHLGRWAELFAELPSLLGPARDQGNLYLEIHLRHWVQSFELLLDDSPEAADELIGDSIRDWSHHGFHFQHFGHLYAAAQVALYRGHGRQAWERVNARWAELTGSMIQRIEMVLIQSWDLRARCALAAAGETEDRSFIAHLLAQAEAGARKIESAGSSWSAALAGALRAGAASIRGHRDTALGQLEIAARAFSESDMAAHAAVARRRFDRLFSGSAAPDDERLLQELGVRDPDRLAAVLLPGRWRLSTV